MAEVAKAPGQAADLLDDQVDGLGAAVGHPVGIEVGQHLLPPGAEGAAEAGDFGDRAVWNPSITFAAIARTVLRSGVAGGAERGWRR
jgi:hypothetical protein